MIVKINYTVSVSGVKYPVTFYKIHISLSVSFTE